MPDRIAQREALRLQRNLDEPANQDRFAKCLITAHFLSVDDIRRQIVTASMDAIWTHQDNHRRLTPELGVSAAFAMSSRAI
jgi:hypothetical protein